MAFWAPGAGQEPQRSRCPSELCDGLASRPLKHFDWTNRGRKTSLETKWLGQPDRPRPRFRVPRADPRTGSIVARARPRRRLQGDRVLLGQLVRGERLRQAPAGVRRDAREVQAARPSARTGSRSGATSTGLQGRQGAVHALRRDAPETQRRGRRSGPTSTPASRRRTRTSTGGCGWQLHPEGRLGRRPGGRRVERLRSSTATRRPAGRGPKVRGGSGDRPDREGGGPKFTPPKFEERTDPPEGDPIRPTVPSTTPVVRLRDP